jgi:hypothetical protein
MGLNYQQKNYQLEKLLSKFYAKKASSPFLLSDFEA